MKRVYRLLVSSLIVIVSACAEAPPVPATIGEFCSLDPGTVVMVKGHLHLPLALRCQEGRCRLNFGDGTNSIMVEMRASEQPGVNMLKLPPARYTRDDLQIVLDDGTTADHTTLVSVTGRVRRPSANDCYLAASSVRLP